MPICGINISCIINDFDCYRKSVPFLRWNTPTDLTTGELIFKEQRNDKKGRYSYKVIAHTAEYKHLLIKVNETHRIPLPGSSDHNIKKLQFELTIVGSLHKNEFGNNYEPFYFSNLKNQLAELESILNIDLKKAIIKSIEVGLNIVPTVPVKAILDSLLTYKGNTFNRYKNKQFGKYCPLSEFDIKIYNKGYEYGLKSPLLRYELHFNKMRNVNRYGISTLQDLNDSSKVKDMGKLLYNVWEHILMLDPVCLRSKELSKRDHEFLKDVINPVYWETLYKTVSRPFIKKQRDRLKLINAALLIDHNRALSHLITEAWQKAFTNELTFSPGAQIKRKQAKVNVFTLIMNGENVNLLTAHEANGKRFCKTCKKELAAAQRRSSIFCSAKYVGAIAAKQCRNKDSNSRNNAKRKVKNLRKDAENSAIIL